MEKPDPEVGRNGEAAVCDAGAACGASCQGGQRVRTTGSNGGPLLQGGAPEPRGWLSQWGERHSQLFDPLAGRLLRSPLLV